MARAITGDFMNARLLATVTLCGAVLSGCATVTEGTSQRIAIVTPPAAGANCTLTGNEGSWLVATPGVVRVEKSKEDIALHCSKAGWQDASAVIPSSFQGWTLGNAIIGGVAGVAVDAASGASNEYPHAFYLPMTPLPGTQVSAADAAEAQRRLSATEPRVDTSGVNMQPNYPETALFSGETGDVAVRVHVRDDGTVSSVSLQQSSGYDDLDAAACNAVLHWKFFPAVSNGEPTVGDTVVMLKFQPPSN